jgi:hypothetical protein
MVYVEGRIEGGLQRCRRNSRGAEESIEEKSRKKRSRVGQQSALLRIRKRRQMEVKDAVKGET